MKKFLSLLITLFLLNASANAANQATPSNAANVKYDQEKVCKVSAACKKFCDLKISDDLEKATLEQQQIIVTCSQDMIKKINYHPKK